MKIQYVHASAPQTTKILDTEKSLAGSMGFIRAMGSRVPTQKEWDEQELTRLEKDKKRGHVLSYGIVIEKKD